jgi:hypothetical protein
VQPFTEPLPPPGETTTLSTPTGKQRPPVATLIPEC